jgi:hypothetical protein
MVHLQAKRYSRMLIPGQRETAGCWIYNYYIWIDRGNLWGKILLLNLEKTAY